jgi:hypothetical protein
VPSPGNMNTQAANLGPSYNLFAPAFIRYRPAPYLRPYDLGRRNPFF